MNIAIEAGSRISISSTRTRRTAGSAATDGGPVMAISGCAARTSLAGPQYGRRNPHSSLTAADGPTSEEQRRPWRSARSANDATAAGVACTGTRFAPE